MAYRFSIRREVLEYSTDTVQEYAALLRLLGVSLPNIEKTSMVCEQCGHSQCGTRRLGYE